MGGQRRERAHSVEPSGGEKVKVEVEVEVKGKIK
jgi:hypothetical protein